MSEIDAKVNMSLDDIIKLEKKKKKSGNSRAGQQGGGGGGRSSRGMARGGNRGSNNRGRSARRSRSQSRNQATRGAGRGNFRNKQQNQQQNFRGPRGEWRKNGQQSGVRGGFIKKRYQNKNLKTNLARSQSNLALNKQNNQKNQQNNFKGGFASNNRQNGKFGLTRSRSRTNLAFKSNFGLRKGSLKRTNSMPNLQDPLSVHNRLGYQSPKQLAYRNRVKRAKALLLQRQKLMGNPHRFTPPARNSMLSPRRGLGPSMKVLSTSAPRYSSSSLRSEQMHRNQQKRLIMEQKLMRMNSARQAPPMTYMDVPRSMSHYREPGPLVLASSRPIQRGRSPFRQTTNMRTGSRRARSRSRSRSRSRNRSYGLEPMSMIDDADDRSFSEVMYSLSGNLGVTGRTLNDRFSY